ncbi:unnamed protein product, partial [Symbiodinium microadriaticum]
MDSSGEPSYGNSGALSGGHDSERLARSPGGGDVYGGNPSAYDVASDGGAAVREQRGRQGGDRTPEQEAAAILEAVDGLEPEYEFQSVEGGGNGSPGQAQDSYHGVDDGSLNGPGDRVPRAVEERAVDGGRLNGVARELGVSRTSGGQSEGAERQLYRLAQSGVTSAADVGGPSLEGLNPERERNDVLETLVQQLLRQNEILAATRAMQQLSLEDREVSRMTDQFSWDEVLSRWVYPHLRRCKLQTRKLWRQQVGFDPVSIEWSQVNTSTAAGVVDGSALGLEDGDAKDFRMFQPGGLSERSELLKGLTGLPTCDTASIAVLTLQKWFRILPLTKDPRKEKRGLSLGIPIPNQAPGGGKAPKDGTQSEATGDDSSSKGKKGKPKGGDNKAPKGGQQTAPKNQSKGASSGISEATIREAAQILQSLKISALRADLDSASQVLKVVCVEGRKGLIDGGATSCLRTAYTTELTLPTIPVKLACGSCDLHINAYGTLLSRTPVSPIISVKALLKLGYRIDWNASRCRVSHPKFGELSVDTRTGCPEVDEEVALDLINQYELYVGHHDNRCARLKCIIEDLKEKGLEDLLEVIRAGDSHADAAFSVYIDRLFPELSAELKERCVVSLQDAVEETWTWNRRTRRRCMKSQGIVIHAFCEQAKKALEHVSERWDFVHLPVNTAEDLLNDSTYRYLLQQARDGRVRGVVGSPPSRTFSTARYLQDGGNKGLRPIRVPGESVGEYGVKDLTCQEQAQRNVDDTLLMRFLVLTAFSVDSNKGLGIPVPACILESPCPENEMPAGIQGISEGVRQASVWNTPEWELLEGKIG